MDYVGSLLKVIIIVVVVAVVVVVVIIAFEGCQIGFILYKMIIGVVFYKGEVQLFFFWGNRIQVFLFYLVFV